MINIVRYISNAIGRYVQVVYLKPPCLDKNSQINELIKQNQDKNNRTDKTTCSV